MPESLWKVIEEISWDSRLSMNITLLALIRAGLVDLLSSQIGQKREFDFTSFGLEKSKFTLSLNSIRRLQDEAPDVFAARKKEIQEALIELLQWVEENVTH